MNPVGQAYHVSWMNPKRIEYHASWMNHHLWECHRFWMNHQSEKYPDRRMSQSCLNVTNNLNELDSPKVPQRENEVINKSSTNKDEWIKRRKSTAATEWIMSTHLCTKGSSPKLHVRNCGLNKCVHFYNKICPEHEPRCLNESSCTKVTS